MKEELRRALNDHASYTKLVKGYDGQATSMQWKSVWPNSAELALSLGERLIFKVAFHVCYRTGLKNRKATSEIFTYQQIQEDWEEKSLTASREDMIGE